MDKVIIDVPSLSNTQNVTNGSLASALIIKAYKNGIFIHENATNGEVIQALFPNIDNNFSNIIDLNMWWKAKYKKKEEVHCNHTDAEIAKSFIEDVEAVKDLLPQESEEV